MPTAECYPITVAPGLSRLFLDFCAGAPAVRAFYGDMEINSDWKPRPPVPAHWPEMVALLAEQNPGAGQAKALEMLRQGAGSVVTGQQVGLFGGPLFTPFKAATAIARAREATSEGKPHAAIFWLASEDHDFPEINHVTFPAKRELRKLIYEKAPEIAVPVGGLVLDESIGRLVDEAAELLGYSEALDALTEAYQPGRTLAQAFARFYSRVFAAQGLLILDASGRTAHRLGAPVLLAALEQADELHSALVRRNKALDAAGYHAQVAVASQSSLLFLVDAKTGARVALKRQRPTAAEPGGLWHAGRDRFSTADLAGILEAEPERISPAALLRPAFQDYLLGTSLIIGGPAELAYFAQSAVVFERVLGRMTPVHPRFSATLVEPDVAALLAKHGLTLERLFGKENGSSVPMAADADELAHLLGARSMPVEGKLRLAAAGNALDAELEPLLEYLRGLDAGLGRSAETAASKMRYQMKRLRRLAANFQLEKEESLARHAEAICMALYPQGTLQERLHGAAWYFARHGFELAETLVEQAGTRCGGHTAVWL